MTQLTPLQYAEVRNSSKCLAASPEYLMEDDFMGALKAKTKHIWRPAGFIVSMEMLKEIEAIGLVDYWDLCNTEE